MVTHQKDKHLRTWQELRSLGLRAVMDMLTPELATEKDLTNLQSELASKDVGQRYQYIGVFQGFKCTACTYKCRTKSSATHHQTYCLGKKGADFCPCLVSTFFSGTSRKYFEVNSLPVAPPSDDETEIEFLRQALLCNEDVAPDRHTPMMPWHERTNWPRYGSLELISAMVPYTLAKSDKLPRTWISRINVLTNRLLQNGLHSIERSPTLLLRQLKSPNVELSWKPFSQKQTSKTHQDYFTTWVRFLIYVLSVGKLPENLRQECHIKISESQQNLIDQILSDLSFNELNPDSADDDEEMEQSLLHLSLLFLKDPLPLTNRFENAILNFVALLGFDVEQQSFRPAETSTRIFASLTYCARLIVLHASWVQYDVFIEDGQTEDQARSNFDAVFQDWRESLLETKSYAIGELLSMHALGKVLANNTWLLGKLQWSKDQLSIYYKGDKFEILKFREFIQHLFNEAEKTLKQLLLTEEFPKIDLGNLMDIPSNISEKFNFLKHNANGLADKPEWLLRYVQADETLRSRFFPYDSHTLCQREVALYELDHDRFLSLLAMLILCTSGQAARGPELLSATIQNTSTNVRSFYVIDNDIMFLTSYNKTMSTTGQLKVSLYHLA